MKNRMLAALAALVISRPLLILLLGLLPALVSLPAVVNLKLVSDYLELLPSGCREVKDLSFIARKIGGLGTFSIVIFSDQRNIKGMKALADDLARKLSLMPELQYVEYRFPRDFLEDHFYLFMEEHDLNIIAERFHEKVQYEIWKNSPMYIDLEKDSGGPKFDLSDIIKKYREKFSSENFGDSDYFISADLSMLVIYTKPVFLPTRTDQTRLLREKIQKCISDLGLGNYGHDLSIGFNGNYCLMLDQREAITRDIGKSSILAVIFIFLILTAVFSRLLPALLLSISLAAGIIPVFGLAQLFFGSINLVTGFLMAILSGLGVNYGIFFILRYQEALNSGLKKKQAIQDSFTGSGGPSLAGALTTAVSFFILCASRFR
ncbi:MAG TPA: hypothetical protein DC049_03710, partial [Spirochaetia bacterium]|nr:hypothetical protein [Spirochaetia bacterium]